MGRLWRLFLRCAAAAGLALSMLMLVAGPACATLNFDGTDDDVNFGNITALNSAPAATVMVWLRIDVEDGSAVWGRNNGNPGLQAVTTGDNTAAGLSIIYNTGITATQAGSLQPAGVFHHQTIVFNGAGATNAQRHQHYVNGVLDTTTFLGTVPSTLASASTNPLYIGRNSTGLNGDVTLAHFRVWLGALSQEEVTHEMHSYRPRRTKDLIIWAPLDDALLARDYSGTGTHGAVTGAVTTPDTPPVSGQ